MLNKIKHITLAILTLSGLIALFSFAASHGAGFSEHSPDIRLTSRNGNYFIDYTSIESIIYENTRIREGKAINKKTLEGLNNILCNMPHTEHVKTYRTISGRLGVEVSLRNPVIRVINNNESFYIDENGYMFPLSELHTARVLIATGNIPAIYSAGRNILKPNTDGDDTDATDLAGLFAVASFIHNDEFWRAFIDQIYVLPNGKFELIPKNGYHTIEFGNPELIDEKFRKLKVFYVYGLSRKGWHYYNKINLEYNNQIICSK